MVVLFEGTTIVVLAGGGGLLLLMHPDSAASIASETSSVFMLNPLVGPKHPVTVRTACRNQREHWMGLHPIATVGCFLHFFLHFSCRASIGLGSIQACPR